MWARQIGAFVWKDIRLFLVDRQAVVMSFVVPVLIASILGWLDSSAASENASHPTPVLWVDLDHSSASRSVSDQLTKRHSLQPVQLSLDEATRLVKKGEYAVAAVIPRGFETQASAALLGGKKPVIQFLIDPSKTLETSMIRGLVIERAAQTIAAKSFGGLVGDGSAPFDTQDTPIAATREKWSSAAHDYAGFGIQGLLFFAMEAAVALTRERRLGIWKRLSAAPIPSGVMIWSKWISSTLLAIAILSALLVIGAGLFGIRVLGSFLGFLEIVVAAGAMAASFGILIATVGKSEGQSRGISILLILVMLATGGAWFPMEKMPIWVQSIANWLPVRWAVEGLDAATWRGLGLAETSRFAGVLLLFALVFLVLATLRFRMREAQSG